ncbi:MAG: 50S ribosomal protein L13, partial [Acidobacteriaceae bacterium]|nr:50S ribosomal protein L13 [Acidobacteriaceae bacterium]
MRTEFPSQHEITRAWHVIDAKDAVLGRVASRAAMLLMGKHKPIWVPSLDTGDHVVIINAAQVKLTGGKENQKVY